MRIRPKHFLSLVFVCGAAACGGNNIGVLWDPDRGTKTPTDGSGVAVVSTLGRLVDARPRVEEAYPKGGGWPTSVPVVVVFSESLARASVEPEAGSGGGGGAPLPGNNAIPGVSLRVEGTTQALPVTYSWLSGDRVVVLTPSAQLDPTAVYEVVVTADVRDVDGVRKGGAAASVVATFTADRDEANLEGRIVATVPKDNETGVEREADLLTIFDRPAEVETVTDTSFVVRAGGSAVDGNREFPVRIAGVADPRILRFRPSSTLPGGADVEIEVDETIKFVGGGALEFSGRRPFARFTTVRGAAPTAVAIGNAPIGFPDQVNASNLSNLAVDVDVDGSVTAGSRIVVRIYGFEPATQDPEDLTFVERDATVPVDGPTTVAVSFAGELGAPDRLKLGEGPLTLVARVEVDRAASSFATTADGNDPSLDVTLPEIQELWPGLPGSSTDVVTDQESIAFMASASEPIGMAELTAGGATVAMFGSSADGSLVFAPLALGQRTEPLAYTMAITDRAGNSTAMPVQGVILQRGLVAGTVAGSLTVEVYDDATYAPIAGALVVVEPDRPQKPAVGRVVGTTDANGRATLQGLSASRHTITAVADDYHLMTVLDVPSAFVSLPLRPIDDEVASATIQGSLSFIPAAGETALVGVNALVDPLALEVQTSSTQAPLIPPTRVRAGRPMVVNVFTGPIPAAATPTFTGYACRMCGPDGSSRGAPELPLSGGSELDLLIPILPSVGAATSLAIAHEVDFAAAAGLGMLSGDPVVRVHGTLQGFGRSALFGVGFPTLVAGSAYSIQASYALPAATTLADFAPTLWVTTEARDQDGNVARHRQLVSDISLGLTFPTGAPIGVPTIAPPAGATTGAPLVEFEDRLDPAGIPGGVAFFTLRVVDPAGRQWEVTTMDRDGVGGRDSIQLPDLGGLSVTGLGVGTWTVEATAELIFSGTSGDGQFVLEERHRQLVKLASAVGVPFTVQ